MTPSALIGLLAVAIYYLTKGKPKETKPTVKPNFHYTGPCIYYRINEQTRNELDHKGQRKGRIEIDRNANSFKLYYAERLAFIETFDGPIYDKKTKESVYLFNDERVAIHNSKQRTFMLNSNVEFSGKVMEQFELYDYEFEAVLPSKS